MQGSQLSGSDTLELLSSRSSTALLLLTTSEFCISTCLKESWNLLSGVSVGFMCCCAWLRQEATQSMELVKAFECFCPLRSKMKRVISLLAAGIATETSWSRQLPCVGWRHLAP